MKRMWWLALAAAVSLGCNGHSTSAASNPPPSNMLLIAADRNGDLYSIDPMTGTDTLLLSTFTSDGMGGTTEVGVISSMVYVPSLNRLLVGTGGHAAIPESSWAINSATGEATLLANNANVANGMAGMAIRASDEAVFSSAGDGDGFLRVDPMTGIATAAGSFGTGTGAGNALTFAANGDLILAADEVLFVVNQATGQGTQIATMMFSGFPAFTRTTVSIVSMATASDGTIFGIVQDGGGTGGAGAGSATYLATINLTTGEITYVGQFAHHLDGLAFVPTALFP